MIRTPNQERSPPQNPRPFICSENIPPEASVAAVRQIPHRTPHKSKGSSILKTTSGSLQAF